MQTVDQNDSHTQKVLWNLEPHTCVYLGEDLDGNEITRNLTFKIEDGAVFIKFFGSWMPPVQHEMHAINNYLHAHFPNQWVQEGDLLYAASSLEAHTTTADTTTPPSVATVIAYVHTAVKQHARPAAAAPASPLDTAEKVTELAVPGVTSKEATDAAKRRVLKEGFYSAYLTISGNTQNENEQYQRMCGYFPALTPETYRQKRTACDALTERDVWNHLNAWVKSSPLLREAVDKKVADQSDEQIRTWLEAQLQNYINPEGVHIPRHSTEIENLRDMICARLPGLVRKRQTVQKLKMMVPLTKQREWLAFIQKEHLLREINKMRASGSTDRDIRLSLANRFDSAQPDIHDILNFAFQRLDQEGNPAQRALRFVKANKLADRVVALRAAGKTEEEVKRELFGVIGSDRSLMENSQYLEAALREADRQKKYPKWTAFKKALGSAPSRVWDKIKAAPGAVPAAASSASKAVADGKATNNETLNKVLKYSALGLGAVSLGSLTGALALTGLTLYGAVKTVKYLAPRVVGVGAGVLSGARSLVEGAVVGGVRILGTPLLRALNGFQLGAAYPTPPVQKRGKSLPGRMAASIGNFFRRTWYRGKQTVALPASAAGLAFGLLEGLITAFTHDLIGTGWNASAHVSSSVKAKLSELRSQKPASSETHEKKHDKH